MQYELPVPTAPGLLGGRGLEQIYLVPSSHRAPGHRTPLQALYSLQIRFGCGGSEFWERLALFKARIALSLSGSHWQPEVLGSLVTSSGTNSIAKEYQIEFKRSLLSYALHWSL